MGRLPSWSLVVIILWSLVIVMIATTHPVWLSNDGPQQIFAAVERGHIAQGAASSFIVNDAITSRGAVDVMGLALHVAEWERAWMLTLAVALLVWAWGFFFLVRRLSTSSPLALLGCATAWSWPLFMGLIPFVFACGVSWVAVGFAVTADDEELGLGRVAIVTLLLWVCARLHVAPTLCAGLVVAGLWLGKRLHLRTLVLVTIAGAPAASVALLATEFASVAGDSGGVYPADRIPLADLGVYLVGGPPWSAGLMIVGTAFAACVAIVRGDRTARVVGGVGLALLVLASVTPRDILGWQFAATRPMPSAMAFSWAALAGLTPRMSKRVLHVLAAGVLIWWARAAQVASASLSNVSTQSSVVEDIRALPVPKRHRLTLVVARPPAIADQPRVAPLLHLGQLVAAEHGGSDHFGQDQLPSVHTILRGPDFCTAPIPTHADMATVMPLAGPARHAAMTRLMQRAWAHDSVVVLGAPDDAAAYLEAGFEIVNSSRGLSLLRARRCTLSVSTASDVGELDVVRGDQALMRLPPVEGTLEVERLPCVGLSVRATSGKCTVSWQADSGDGVVVATCVLASQ